MNRKWLTIEEAIALFNSEHLHPIPIFRGGIYFASVPPYFYHKIIPYLIRDLLQ